MILHVSPNSKEIICAIIANANRLKNASVKIASVRIVIARLKSRLEVLTDLLEFYNDRVQAGSTLTRNWASPDVWLRDIAYLRELLREHCPGYVDKFDAERKEAREYRAKLLDRFTDR